MYKLINQRRLKRLAIAGIIMAVAIPSLIMLGKSITAYYTQRIHRLFTPQKIVCYFHEAFTPISQTQIASYLTSTLTQSSITEADQPKFFSNLKKKFPIIKEAIWKLLPSQTLQVTILGTKAYCTINSQYVLGDQQTLLKFTDFSSDIIQQLPNIIIAQKYLTKKDTLPKKLYSFLHKIPTWLWNGYTINYTRPSRIEITPQQSLCRCIILTDENSAFDIQKWDALNSIFTNIAQQQLITKKMLQAKRPVLALDIRLKNRIIVKFFQSMVRGRGS